MTAATISALSPRLSAWIIAILSIVPTLLIAATEEIVGTWRRPDQSMVEFKIDGSVATESGPVGNWERLRDSPKFVLRFTGNRDFYYVTIGSYKRQLTMELQSRGIRTSLERIDNGPTQNPDVPDEKSALQLETIDLQAETGRISIEIDITRKEAAQLWAKYEEGRALGKATGINMQAQHKDTHVKNLELRLINIRKRLVMIDSRLAALK